MDTFFINTELSFLMNSFGIIFLAYILYFIRHLW